ncbi:hypothetical protein YTPLAS18_22170 [Nitrospira sp.]|nr:hypothetical protein YTPLAS18_22170 [Nitrospira sp.]
MEAEGTGASQSFHHAPTEAGEIDLRHAELVRRYATRVTVVLMVVCPTLFLAGMWGSGVQPEQLFSIPEHYKPSSDICVRQGWQRVTGKDDLVRVCSEWLDSTDPSGETHQLQTTMQIHETADGRLYYESGSRADWHLAAFVAFVAAILAFGWFVRRYLVARYRRQLETMAAKQALAAQVSS